MLLVVDSEGDCLQLSKQFANLQALSEKWAAAVYFAATTPARRTA
jgi:hypothetical protein